MTKVTVLAPILLLVLVFSALSVPSPEGAQGKSANDKDAVIRQLREENLWMLMQIEEKSLKRTYDTAYFSVDSR